MARLPKRDIHGAGSPSPSTVVAEEVLTPTRTGMPAAAAAVGVAKTYRILVTNQTDPYDGPVSLAAAATFAAGGGKFPRKDPKEGKPTVLKANGRAFVEVKE